jgi:hypothetical protein
VVREWRGSGEGVERGWKGSDGRLNQAVPRHFGGIGFFNKEDFTRKAQGG